MIKLLITVITSANIIGGIIGFPFISYEPASDGCERMGWFPNDFGLKDHSIFLYAGYYYLVSNFIPGESKFAYARSADLCTWEDLGPILDTRTPDSWDEIAVWAPYVWQENGIYYMIYTGVAKNVTQSIMLATSKDPSDPESWQTHGMVFQPSHIGMVWEAGNWADGRDPMIIKFANTYYLYYTGLDIDGGIVGMATATSPFGPWVDWGTVITPLSNNAMAESATIVYFEGSFYLFYHDTSQGEVYRIGGSQAGPWGPAIGFKPGWAHEVWQASNDQWYTSYLQDYSVTISPVTWDDFFSPAKPTIGSKVYHMLLPTVLQLDKDPISGLLAK